MRSPWLAPLVLLAAAFAYRLPELAAAEAILNSDSAVVGLQALHWMKGERSWLLWGTTYQGVLEVLCTIPFLLAFPARPALALMLESVFGHLALVLALWALASRVAGPWRGALATA